MKDYSRLLTKEDEDKNKRCRFHLGLMHLDEMAVYIHFNNGHSLLLSTVNKVFSVPKAKKIEEAKLYCHPDDRYPLVFTAIEEMLRNNFELHRIYTIARSCPECSMIFAGFSKSPRLTGNNRNTQKLSNFELFCANYINAFKSVIFQVEPTCKYAHVFNNAEYLRRIIKGGNADDNLLTEKERLCLSLASLGLSYKAIARELNISSETVKYHYRNIKEKLSCSSILESAIVALYMGEIGCL